MNGVPMMGFLAMVELTFPLGKRRDHGPYPDRQPDVVDQERSARDDSRTQHERAEHETRVHEHRHQQAPGAVVDPHHENPEGRQLTNKEQEAIRSHEEAER